MSRKKNIKVDCKTDKVRSDYELDDEGNDRHKSSFKVKSLVQIMYYHATYGRHKKKTLVIILHTVYEKCKSRELTTAFIKQCMCISYKVKSQWSNLAKLLFFTACQLQFVYLVTSMHKALHKALGHANNTDRNSLSGRKHVHNVVITVFQVKPSTMKCKPTISFTDISAIKNLEKLKCQEIVSFHYNQKLPLESTFLVGLELYTNPKIADNSSTAEFILNCFQSVSLHQKVGEKDIIPSWVCVRSILSSAEITEMHIGFLPFIPNP